MTGRRRPTCRSYVSSSTARFRAAAPSTLAERVVAEHPIQRGTHAVDVVRIDDEPGLAVHDRLVRTTAATRDRRHAARRRLDEHDPVALGLQAAPSLPAHHGEDVRASVQGGEIRFGHPTEERAAVGDPALGGAACEAPSVAAGAPHRELHSGIEAGDGVDQDVEALARNEAAEAEHEGAFGGEAEPMARRDAFRRAQGTEAVGVDTRRHDQCRERGAGNAGGDPRRVLPCRDQTRSRTQDAPGERPAPGQPSRHVDLGAVRDQHMRRGMQTASDQTQRQHRIEEDHVDFPLARHGVDATGEARRRQQHPLAHSLDAEALCRVPVRRARIRRRQHVRLLGREAPPQLVQVRLDAAHLGWEVVRDKERRHRAARAYAGTRPAAAPAGCAAPRAFRPDPTWRTTTPIAAAIAPPANAPR